AIAAACKPMLARHGMPTAIGLCLPGLFDHETRKLTRSINLPWLVGVPINTIVRAGIPYTPPALVVTDAFAAAFDLWSLETIITPQNSGRWFTLSLGTGVGACVLDDGQPLHVSGTSPGHFGQLDVSADPTSAPIGPDGGRGSLEAYIGVPALCAKHGCPPSEAVTHLLNDSTAIEALAKSLRIAHAIYRPQHIRLLGGIGIRLTPLHATLLRLTSHQLTSIARQDWTLGFGHNDFHAAAGAARLAHNASSSTNPPASLGV
ncbi:MAG: ROK family protein, partial [bacterium]|nr:ROK family protein [bacterium]